jgi:hypothetical protein
MEIRSVKKREVSYPKMREVSVEKVKKAIPNTWVKLGITGLVFNVLMGNKVWGISNEFNISNQFVSGMFPRHRPIFGLIGLGYLSFSFVSLIIAISTAIMILYKKIKYKKDNTIKVSKKIKKTFIVSSIFVVLGIIGAWISSKLYYR